MICQCEIEKAATLMIAYIDRTGRDLVELIRDIKTSLNKIALIIAGHHEGVLPWAVRQHNIQG